jgi:hypothetical protein
MRWIVEGMRRCVAGDEEHHLVWVGDVGERAIDVINRAIRDDPYWTRDVKIRPLRNFDPQDAGPHSVMKVSVEIPR